MMAVILIGCALVAVTVFVHAAGLSLVLRLLPRAPAEMPTRHWSITWLLIHVVMSLILIHLAEITVWALCYWWAGCLPNAESAVYFSGVSYTTIGFGDVVLSEPWRLLSPVEGLTGILMCGLSAGLLFALLSRIYELRTKKR
ncbi:MAG: potassium channel family protein [Syntrophobacter sp.]